MFKYGINYYQCGYKNCKIKNRIDIYFINRQKRCYATTESYNKSKYKIFYLALN